MFAVAAATDLTDAALDLESSSSLRTGTVASSTTTVEVAAVVGFVVFSVALAVVEIAEVIFS